MVDHNDACALVLAGGSGTRLWPWSRAGRTKPFLHLVSAETTLLQQTVARLSGLIPAERILVVTARGHSPIAREQLPAIPPQNVWEEPVSANTEPAVSYGAAIIEHRFGDVPIVVLAADNVIGDIDAFHDTMRSAIDAAAQGDCLVSIGVTPTEATSRFGYMRAGEMVGPQLPTIREYVEKPAATRAETMLAEGNWWWNAGVFCWRPSALFTALAHCNPENFAVADKLRVALHQAVGQAECDAIFERFEPISIDNGVMERLRSRSSIDSVLVLGRFDWDDVGDFPAQRRHTAADDVWTSGDVIAENCADCVLVAESPYRVHAHNLRGVVAVVTDDGKVLVRSRSDQGPVNVHVTRFSDTVRLEPGNRSLRLHVDRTHQGLSIRAADLLADYLRDLLDHQDRVVLIVSAGKTPGDLYAHLRANHRATLDWSRITMFQMDEYVGVSPDDPRSFAYYLRCELVEPLGIGEFHSLPSAAELPEFEQSLAALGGPDVLLHGVGCNGHLGFNEPGSSRTGSARLVPLAPSTRASCADLFHPDPPPTHGLTLGLELLFGAPRQILVASGTHKSDAIWSSLFGPVTSEVPASWLQEHDSVDVFLDEEACTWLNRI